MADRYLIESSSVDGYQLEDSSGVLLLEGASLPKPNRLMQATIVAAWTVVTAVPLYASVLLQPVPVDAPPASHEGRTVAVQASIVAQWEPGPPAPQWNRALPQGAVVNDPPFSARARTAPPQWQWEALSWSVQPKPSAVPAGPSVAVVNDPPFSSRSIEPVLSWCTPPVCTPLWSSAVLMQGVSIESPAPLHAGRTVQAGSVIAQSVPSHWSPPSLRQLVQPSVVVVNDPPFGRRTAVELISRTWESQATQAVWGWRIVSAPDDLPALHPGRLEQAVALVSTWEPLNWPSQQRPKLSQPSVQAVDNPPVRQASRTIQIQSAIAQSVPLDWTVPPVRPLVQPSTAAVNDPPFSNRAREIQPELLWESVSWTVTVRDQIVQSGVVPDLPPIGRSVDRRIVYLWEPLSWSAQRAPQGVLVQSVAGPPVPFKRPQFETILRSWEVEPVLVRPVAHVPDGVPAVVNDPPWHARRQYQYLTATWTAEVWSTQTRIPLSVDGTNIAFIRIVGVVSGPLSTCRSITVSQPTVQNISGAIPTARHVQGVL